MMAALRHNRHTNISIHFKSWSKLYHGMKLLKIRCEKLSCSLGRVEWQITWQMAHYGVRVETKIFRTFENVPPFQFFISNYSLTVYSLTKEDQKLWLMRLQRKVTIHGRGLAFGQIRSSIIYLMEAMSFYYCLTMCVLTSESLGLKLLQKLNVFGGKRAR